MVLTKGEAMELDPHVVEIGLLILTVVLTVLTLLLIILTLPLTFDAYKGISWQAWRQDRRRMRVQREHNDIGKEGFPTRHLDNPQWRWEPQNLPQDCTKEVDGDALRISVKKAGYDLWPATNFKAPRLLTLISSDFFCSAHVSCKFGAPVQGAGLLVWRNEQNFWRLNRINWWGGKEYVTLEGCVNGVYSTAENRAWEVGQSVFLEMQYISLTKRLTARYSKDARKWENLVGTTFDPQGDFSVGLFVMNESGRNDACQADFRNFSLRHL
jgi:hypothetical protein